MLHFFYQGRDAAPAPVCNSDGARRPRQFTERINFDFLDDAQFSERFRLNKVLVDYLEERIGLWLRHQTQRNHALSPRHPILLCLQLLSDRGFYQLYAFCTYEYYIQCRCSGCPYRPKSTICRTVHSSATINGGVWNECRPIHFPLNVGQVQRFFDLHYFPNVCSTSIQINAPSINKHQFVDVHEQKITCIVGLLVCSFISAAPDRYRGSVTMQACYAPVACSTFSIPDGSHHLRRSFKEILHVQFLAMNSSYQKSCDGRWESL